jgi:hypothetical protein
MNKIKEFIEQNKGKGVEIPDVVRVDLPEFFKAMGYKKGVEIGVYKAEFTEDFAKAGLEVHGVDPWMEYGVHNRDLGFDPERYERMYEGCKKVLEPYPNAHLIRKTSMDALEDFEDESIDFVYIDGDHRFRYVAEDLDEWAKKVRKGGVVSGHDYIDERRLPTKKWGRIHSKYIVDAYMEAYRIKNWYILGRRTPKFKGEKRNLYRSWFFIKE